VCRVWLNDMPQVWLIEFTKPERYMTVTSPVRPAVYPAVTGPKHVNPSRGVRLLDAVVQLAVQSYTQHIPLRQASEGDRRSLWAADGQWQTGPA